MESLVVEPQVANLDLDARVSLVIQVEWMDTNGWMLGETVCHRQKVWIQHDLETVRAVKITFLDLVVTRADNIPSLKMDRMSFSFVHQVLTPESLLQVVETCSGLGALGHGAEAAGFKVMARNEVRHEICDFLERQGGPVIIRGDIGDSITVATIMKQVPTTGVLTAGVSCQPFSRMGDRRGSADVRASCLPKVLRAAYWMQVPIIVLECVAEVVRFPAFDRCIKAFCEASGFHYESVLLELGDVWVSRRHRWWGVLSKKNLGPFKLFDWNGIKSTPKISSVLNCFDTVPPEHAKQLALTLYELRSIQELGTLERYVINIEEQAPTAVHSWGSHFHGCRCGCRNTGLTLERLQRDGIHVLLIPVSGSTKHMGMELQHMRYPSGAECALLNGLSPNLQWGQDARLGLCLVGQLASPLQSAWVLTHVRQHLAVRGLLPPVGEGPLEVLSKQRTKLIEEAEQGGFFRFLMDADGQGAPPVGVGARIPMEVHTAPSSGIKDGEFLGIVNGVEYKIPFKAGCQIWHWIQAEMAFHPAGTKFVCVDNVGRLVNLHSELCNATWLRLDIMEGEGDSKVVLPAMIIQDQRPPCILTPQDVVQMRSNGPILAQKLLEVSDPGQPWGDDEIAWHLGKLAEEADSFAVWVDPLVTASHLVHGTTVFLATDAPFFRVQGWLLSVPFIEGHWIPLLGFADEDHVHFSVWDTTSEHFALLEGLYRPLTKLIGAETFSVTKYLRGATNLQSCGPDAILP